MTACSHTQTPSERMAPAIEAAQANAALIAAKAIADKYDRAPIPDQPADCKVIENPDVVRRERLDVSLAKTAKALDRANGRVIRCWEWNDEIRKKINLKPP